MSLNETGVLLIRGFLPVIQYSDMAPANTTSDPPIARMDECGVGKPMQEYLRGCAAFHTYAAPGLLIGAFMVDYALELLGATPDEKLYAVCETPKCVPDALQVIAHCTTGNHRLRIIPIGKFAITVNRASSSTSAEGVRVYLDREKLKQFPVIALWYANSPGYDKGSMHAELEREILRAGRTILSHEKVTIDVTPKRKWRSVTCPVCGETIPDYMMEGDRCSACGSQKYYRSRNG